MQINEIQEQIAVIISNDDKIWSDVLNETSPGNYGCDEWNANVYASDIFVDIPSRTFRVKTGNFFADLVLGASSGDSSFNAIYNRPFSADGMFNFKNSSSVEVTGIQIDINTGIYNDCD